MDMVNVSIPRFNSRMTMDVRRVSSSGGGIQGFQAVLSEVDFSGVMFILVFCVFFFVLVSYSTDSSANKNAWMTHLATHPRLSRNANGTIPVRISDAPRQPVEIVVCHAPGAFTNEHSLCIQPCVRTRRKAVCTHEQQ